jgi:hypothetical protein
MHLRAQKQALELTIVDLRRAEAAFQSTLSFALDAQKSALLQTYVFYDFVVNKCISVLVSIKEFGVVLFDINDTRKLSMRIIIIKIIKIMIAINNYNIIIVVTKFVFITYMIIRASSDTKRKLMRCVEKLPMETLRLHRLVTGLWLCCRKRFASLRRCTHSRL